MQYNISHAPVTITSFYRGATYGKSCITKSRKSLPFSYLSCEITHLPLYWYLLFSVTLMSSPMTCLTLKTVQEENLPYISIKR